jgi:3-hydroxyisobutyrate dehydrogenase-like beta-hydroxyacid dehydrogenase
MRATSGAYLSDVQELAGLDRGRRDGRERRHVQARDPIRASGDATQADGSDAGCWLIIGHGSVGFVLAERVLAAGGSVLVRDDAPRVSPPEHPRVRRVGADERASAAYVALCVPSSVAAEAATYIRRQVDGRPIVFDWASAPPASKVSTAGHDADDWIDVALLDSLDRVVDRPLLAISGSRATQAGTSLRALGFAVDIAGDAVGQAAAVKLSRSLFMKPLEALVVEFRANAKVLDPSGVAWRSIQQNLGGAFADFADVLVTSDVTHAGRRTPELRHAISYATDFECASVVASAAAEVMARLAQHWEETTATSASVDEILSAARPAFQQ